MKVRVEIGECSWSGTIEPSLSPEKARNEASVLKFTSYNLCRKHVFYNYTVRFSPGIKVTILNWSRIIGAQRIGWVRLR